MRKPISYAAIVLTVCLLAGCGEDESECVVNSDCVSGRCVGGQCEPVGGGGDDTPDNNGAMNNGGDDTPENNGMGGGSNNETSNNEPDNNQGSNNGSNNASSNNASTGTSNNDTAGNNDACGEGQMRCDGACVDTDTVDHCGGCDPCGEADGAEVACTDGACAWACSGDAVDVNEDLPDGAEGDGCECTPSGPEVCDGVDNDCDGLADEADDDLELTTCAELTGAEPSACTDGACVYACAEEFVDVNEDLPDGTDGDGCECQSSGEEVCDDVDNDCDGMVDEGCDDDGDGYCDADMDTEGLPDACPMGGGDCLDEGEGAAEVNPGATERCDDIDNNCVDDVDEGCDDDNDGWCDADLAIEGTPAVCPLGGGDCLDVGQGAAEVNPGATEVCDDIDNDCVGGEDDGCDDDDDGWCDAAFEVVGEPAVCTMGVGDCMDEGEGAREVNPGATEICDDVDNNCVDDVDEGCDDDNDGWCDEDMSVSGLPSTCQMGTGDCDDDKSAVNPGHPEVCDGLDNNCENGADTQDPEYDDRCSNQDGVCLGSLRRCVAGEPQPCDDDDYRTHASELGLEYGGYGRFGEYLCDGVDNDCDGVADENCDPSSCGPEIFEWRCFGQPGLAVSPSRQLAGVCVRSDDVVVWTGEPEAPELALLEPGGAPFRFEFATVGWGTDGPIIAVSVEDSGMEGGASWSVMGAKIDTAEQRASYFGTPITGSRMGPPTLIPRADQMLVRFAVERDDDFMSCSMSSSSACEFLAEPTGLTGPEYGVVAATDDPEVHFALQFTETELAVAGPSIQTHFFTTQMRPTWPNLVNVDSRYHAYYLNGDAINQVVFNDQQGVESTSTRAAGAMPHTLRVGVGDDGTTAQAIWLSGTDLMGATSTAGGLNQPRVLTTVDNPDAFSLAMPKRMLTVTPVMLTGQGDGSDTWILYLNPAGDLICPDP